VRRGSSTASSRSTTGRSTSPDPDEQLGDDQLAYFDRLAALTRAPDASFDDLRARFESDDRLRVPETVFNSVRQRQEAV
jgi:hypothetical protein